MDGLTLEAVIKQVQLTLLSITEAKASLSLTEEEGKEIEEIEEILMAHLGFLSLHCNTGVFLPQSLQEDIDKMSANKEYSKLNLDDVMKESINLCNEVMSAIQTLMTASA